jgi:deazaflavin-dependent oxidoreductase (nitroreductase family)
VLSKIIVFFDRVIGRRFYRLHCRVYKWSDGRLGHWSPAGRMLLLTTTGRKSGLARTHPLLYMPRDDGFVVVGSNGGREEPPAWILNLEATPTVKVQVGRKKYTAQAQILGATEKAALWPTLTTYYKGWGDYQKLTERQLNVVTLTPQPTATA